MIALVSCGCRILTSRSIRALIAVMLVGLVVRITLAIGVEIALSQRPDRMFLVPGDAEGYWDLSDDLLTGRDYEIYSRYVLRMPGFPALLAGLRWVTADQRLGVRIGLAVFSTLGVAGTFCLGRQLGSLRVAVLAAGYVAISPLLAGFGILILSEGAFATTLIWAVVAFVGMVQLVHQHAKWPLWTVASILSGLASAAAMMMRPTWWAPLLALMGFWLFFELMKAVRHAFKWDVRPVVCCSLLLATTIGVQLPWALRNEQVSGKFTFTTLWVGPSLYDGLHVGATGDSDMTFFETDGIAGRLPEAEVDARYRELAWKFMAEHPLESARLALVKQWRYWNIVPNAAQFHHWWILLPVALVTVWLYVGIVLDLAMAPRDVQRWIVCLTPVLVFAMLHLLFVGSVRYRLPAELPMAVMAACGWDKIWSFWTQQSFSSLSQAVPSALPSPSKGEVC